MSARTRLGVGIALTAVAALAGVLVRPDLPADVAVRFGFDGQPNRYASKTFALAFVPGVMLAVLALFEGVVRVDPLRENVADFERAYDAVVVATLAFLAAVHGLVLAFNLGFAVPMDRAVALALGGLYVVVGFVLERADRNWTVGVRTPWTLSDDAVWERTHDRAASAFKLAGVVAVALALALPGFAVVGAAAVAVVVAAYAVAYSYVSYRRRHRDGDASTP